MIADGKYELAATTLDWTRGRYGNNARLDALRRTAYQKLTERYQDFNPFKLIIYSGQGGLDIPQLPIADKETAAREHLKNAFGDATRD
jgi:hypothetical protein